MLRDLRSLTVRASAGRPTRRTVLGGLAGAVTLAACAPPPPPSVVSSAVGGSNASGVGATDVGPRLATDRSAEDKLVRFSNWTDYLDRSTDNRTYPTLGAFTAATGIKVSYVEDIDDNDAYFSKIAPQLRSHQDFGRDLVVFSDWMINRIMREQLAAPLDHTVMPHAGNVLEALHNVTFDTGRRFSLPWQSGFAGIAYNRKVLGRDVKSMADLWAADLKGRVTLLSEMRDTVGLIMLAQGSDITGPFTRTEIQRGFDEVAKRVADGHVRRIKGNAYVEDFKSGNAVAGFAWSGDIFSLNAEMGNDDWRFVLPDSGGILWSDDAMIPVTSPHRTAAMKLLDYYYQPEVAAQVAAWVQFICPVRGAQAAMEKVDPTLTDNPFIFPTADYLKSYTHEFRALTTDEDTEYSKTWARVIGN